VDSISSRPSTSSARSVMLRTPKRRPDCGGGVAAGSKPRPSSYTMTRSRPPRRSAIRPTRVA